jgi:hypothetical protein
MGTKKLKRHKPPDINQTQAVLNQAGDRTILSEIHKFINSICNKGELLEEWKESINVPIYRGDKTHCSDFRGISRLSTTYKILSNILPSWLTPHAEEINGDHQCGFRRNKSTTEHIFSIRQIP